MGEYFIGLLNAESRQVQVLDLDDLCPAQANPEILDLIAVIGTDMIFYTYKKKVEGHTKKKHFISKAKVFIDEYGFENELESCS